MTHGYVQEATWLNDDYYLTLVLNPDGAAVWRHSWSATDKVKYLSSQFMEAYICPAELTHRLHWIVSPAKDYIFFYWFDDEGKRYWRLLDISDEANLRLKSFVPPEGMQIEKALFAPDDRYAVFVHDAYHEGSLTSILCLDLAQGSELWRISSGELNFVTQLWWGGAIFDAPRFYAIASLYHGRFYDQPGLATCDVHDHELSFRADTNGQILGAEALWGHVSCHSSVASAEMPYQLLATVTGQAENTMVPLSARPVAITLMPQPGLALITNTDDLATNQLWLVDLLKGDKTLVDSDCEEMSLASDAKVLVRSRSTNELRIYELVEPGY